MIAGALAPAKINLGLEILGRRTDGYHEIRTILAAISFYDRITILPSDRFLIESDVDVGPSERNLVTLAARALAARTSDIDAHIQLRKQIPSAAGLGGASSDAAATLMALDGLNGSELSRSALLEISAGIGSDVPFFVSGGIALAGGKGEQLEHMTKSIAAFAIIVAPHVTFPHKTATMYASLDSDDVSDGRRVEETFDAFRDGKFPQVEALGNAFERPLYERIPWLREIPESMRALGAECVGLSGAGPAHFTLDADRDRVIALGRAFVERFGDKAPVFMCSLVPHGARVETAANECEIERWFEQHGAIDPLLDSAR
jgi:4-diphosphocytidyl-2-C-methyl-D-erythritol kinase